MKKVLFITIISIAFAACTSKADRANKYVESGMKKFYKNDFAGAKTDLTKAIELDPSLYEAIYNRGNCNMGLKKYNEAMDDFSKAIEVNPNYADAFFNRGNLKSFLTGNMKSGCEDWQKAAQLGRPNMDQKLRVCD